jgi:cytochrome c biogenesis protein
MKKAFKLFQSIKLAVALILMIAVLCLIGIFVPQIPAQFSATPDRYAWWIENVAYRQVGASAYTMEALGFFEVFRSGWFIGATVLLILNISACSIPRIKSIHAESTKTRVQTDSDFYQHGKYSYAVDIPYVLKQSMEPAERVLHQHRYTVVGKEASDSICLVGEKHILSRWATLFVHLSLILLLTGVAISALFGVRDDSFIVIEGETKKISDRIDLSIYLKSFTDEYWEDGTPKDYRSEIFLYQDNEKVKGGTVRVNHPLTYQGVAIHQGFFGQAARLSISDAKGNLIYQDSVALTGYQTNDGFNRPKGETSLPQGGYNIVILGSAINGEDPYIGQDQIGIEFYDAEMNFSGWLILGQNTPQQVGDLVFQYTGSQFSGFLISRDPGGPLLLIAAILFLSGLGMIFYFPYRCIWVKIIETSENVIRILVRIDGQKAPGLENEASILLKEIGLTREQKGSMSEG